MSTPRLIRLRRPPVISIHEGVFVPNGDVLNDIDRKWKGLCKANPHYFDGRVLHVLGVHRNGHGGASVHVMDCAYRFFAVQSDDFDLGVRAIGVKGITTQNGQFLLGLRAPTVGCYQNLWEFASGGSVSPGDDPAQLVQSELFEETGLQAVRDPVAAAIIFDPVLRCWELVYRIDSVTGTLAPRTSEYSRVEWRSKHNLPHDLSPIAQQMTALI